MTQANGMAGISSIPLGLSGRNLVVSYLVDRWGQMLNKIQERLFHRERDEEKRQVWLEGSSMSERAEMGWYY